MSGWSWDGDDLDEVARREAENGVRQARRLLELIRDALRDVAGFQVSLDTICELNALAVDGLVDNPGRLRERDVEILGSRHEPPTSREVPALVEDMLGYINRGEHEPMHVTAYVLWRLNWIHPFEGGNGRTSRAVAYLVLSVATGQELPGEVTLVERLVWHKLRYIDALEGADRAWSLGQLDVSALERLVAELLAEQLRSPSEEDDATETLYRPVGQAELDLIAQSGYRAFPPRLPSQPIFYPVLDEDYAVEIARDWNTKDVASGMVGYVTRFRVRRSVATRYAIQVVGASRHRELWVPADELDEFNRSIVGTIEVIAEFRGDSTAR